jgi:hypothetical protein
VQVSGYNDQRRRDRIRGPATAAISAAAVIVLVGWLHGPVVRLALTGDSYQWIQYAHLATHRPAALLADLDSFLRPSTTWTLALDRAVWGGFEAAGFRTSSLVIHGLVALALVAAGRRLGLGPAAAAAVGLVWVSSPFADESAFVVAYRFQPLLLLSWLVLIAVWPRHDEAWGKGRVVAAVLTVASAAAAKETWVVTPALAAALELDRRSAFRAALRPVVTVGAAAFAYVVVYFLAFPGSKSYYELGPHVLAKIPTQLAAFLYLEEPMPFALTLGWQGAVALAGFVAVVLACLRWRVSGVWTALAVFLLPTVPTVLVPFMPQRYQAIPYAGFLLLTALWVTAAADRWPRWRRAIRGGTSVVVVLVVIAGAGLVRADLEDYRRMAAAHEVVLDEAALVAGLVAAGRPVAVLRDERAQPLLEILREPVGFAKLPYTRHADPSGLIDTPALFEWVIAEEGTRVEPVEVSANATGSVLIHVDGGFVDAGTVPDLAAEVEKWQSGDRHVRVIQAVQLD